MQHCAHRVFRQINVVAALLQFDEAEAIGVADDGADDGVRRDNRRRRFIFCGFSYGFLNAGLTTDGRGWDGFRLADAIFRRFRRSCAVGASNHHASLLRCWRSPDGLSFYSLSRNGFCPLGGNRIRLFRTLRGRNDGGVHRVW